MDRILEHIATETNGKTYKSHRFCYDVEINVPSLAYDDRQTFTILNDRNAENAPEKTTKSLKKLADKIQKEQKPLFSYFLDGSRRIYKVDDIEYKKRIFPIIGGQIGVACCQRKAVDNFGKAKLEQHFVLSLPRIATSGEQHETQFIGRLIEKVNKLDRLTRFGIKISDILLYPSDASDNGREEYANRGTTLIQDKMIECEKKVIDNLSKQDLLNMDNYLIKDGSLQYQKTSGDFKELAKYKTNFRRVVGVSKSFNPEFVKDKQNKSNAANIANLPLYHRTPAYRFRESRVGNVDFAIWYVRIRETKYTESPFAGVLKIERVLVSAEEMENGLESSEIDLITANIINERNPVCYGKDQRWANHLYPIYLTETYLKSKFLSDFHFINLF